MSDPLKVPLEDVFAMHRAVPPQGFMASLTKHEHERVERAAQHVLLTEKGAYLAIHDSYHAICDSAGTALWRCWWVSRGMSWDWHEEWTREQPVELV